MSDTLTGNAQYDAITAAIKAFPFWNYGLDETDPNDKYAEWVPDLAAAVFKAAAPDAVRDPQLLARFRDEEGQVWVLLLADETEGPRLAHEEDRDQSHKWLSWHMVADETELTRI